MGKNPENETKSCTGLWNKMFRKFIAIAGSLVTSSLILTAKSCVLEKDGHTLYGPKTNFLLIYSNIKQMSFAFRLQHFVVQIPNAIKGKVWYAAKVIEYSDNWALIRTKKQNLSEASIYLKNLGFLINTPNNTYSGYHTLCSDFMRTLDLP